MRRRLRKKKRLGEFKEFGFEVNARFRDGLTDADDDAFLDRWIEAIEARRLTYGGGNTLTEFAGFVGHHGRGSATEEDREALRLFLENDQAVEIYTLGALIDAWHGRHSP